MKIRIVIALLILIAAMLAGCAPRPVQRADTAGVVRSIAKVEASAAVARGDAKAVREIARETSAVLSRADGKAALIRRWFELQRRDAR